MYPRDLLVLYPERVENPDGQTQSVSLSHQHNEDELDPPAKVLVSLANRF